MSLSIILTCFNEVPIIFDSYKKIINMVSLMKIDYEMLIVDDGSSAEVQSQLKKYFDDKENTSLIFSEANEGRGAAVTKGIKAASKEYVGFIDTDLEIPEYTLLNLYYTIACVDYCDVVIGKRIYLLGANIYHWLRFIYSRIYFLLANVLLKMPFLDTETGVKVFRKDKIISILDFVKDKRWFWDTEIMAESLKHNLKIVQVPVFVSRKKEGSSVNFIRDTYRYFCGLYRYLRNQRSNRQ